MRMFHHGGGAMKLNLGIMAVIFAFLFLITGAVRYNLAAVSAVDQMPPVIIIDAGHGGEDGGAIGVSGALESEINLSVSLRLEQLLSFCGFRTSMIRSSDQAVYSDDCDTITEKKVSDLKNRVRTVNSIYPSVLVSIHQNHFSEEKYAGSQVFYAKTETSIQLAQTMQELLRTTLDPNNHRACKPADSVYLMEHIQCPAVLVECGFLSNREEELRLQQPVYQKKICCAITGALISYTRGECDLEV